MPAAEPGALAVPLTKLFILENRNTRREREREGEMEKGREWETERE